MEIYRQIIDTLFLGFLFVIPVTSLIAMRSGEKLRMSNALFVDAATLMMRVLGLLFTIHFLIWLVMNMGHTVISDKYWIPWLRPFAIIFTTQLLWLPWIRKTPLALAFVALCTIIVQFGNLAIAVTTLQRDYHTDNAILFMLLIGLATAVAVFIAAVRFVMYVQARYKKAMAEGNFEKK